MQAQQNNQCDMTQHLIVDAIMNYLQEWETAYRGQLFFLFFYRVNLEFKFSPRN